MGICAKRPADRRELGGIKVAMGPLIGIIQPL
ncbi:hypothetical protein predicted by Glimmer/Critica (plasmid) [Sinorhizobium fredii HH103]|uniref:Uncharacterized protein n=1 Tax=Sinorhizobium fredii (strain HH103) TaxID=1117943 RepID=G9AIH1_SINF1|nr:hypothetical protein predicted by Glimmer/Critica [Sinorhizobium fredii HH103]